MKIENSKHDLKLHIVDFERPASDAVIFDWEFCENAADTTFPSRNS